MTPEWFLLPPTPGACQTCARLHEPEDPHDAQSLYWATQRLIAGLPAPTWDDALAHVSAATHERWRVELGRLGIAVAPREVTP